MRAVVTVAAMPLAGEYEPSPTDWARKQAELYESSGGTAGTTIQGKAVVVLTTVGNKTGKLRKTPLMRVEHDGRYAVVASLGGAPQHPVWYHNLVAEPHVELQDGTVRQDMTAREVFDDEKAQWWARAVEAWPAYADYQAKTDRAIPVFVLEPVDHLSRCPTPTPTPTRSSPPTRRSTTPTRRATSTPWPRSGTTARSACASTRAGRSCAAGRSSRSRGGGIFSRARAQPVHRHQRRRRLGRRRRVGDARREPRRPQFATGTVAATNTFVRTPAGWKLVLHHGSPVRDA